MSGIAQLIQDPRKVAVITLPPGLKQGCADMMELYRKLYPYTSVDFLLKLDFDIWATALQAQINAALGELDLKISALAVSIPRPFIPGFSPVVVPMPFGPVSVYSGTIMPALPPPENFVLDTLTDPTG